MSLEPDYLICIECETPCYTFDWDNGRDKVTEILCTMCGNDKVEEFQTEDELMGEA